MRQLPDDNHRAVPPAISGARGGSWPRIGAHQSSRRDPERTASVPDLSTRASPQFDPTPSNEHYERVSPSPASPRYGKLLRVSAVGVVVDTATRLITFSVPGRRPSRSVLREIPLTEIAAARLVTLAELAIGYRGNVDGHITETNGQSLSLEFERAQREFGARGHMQGPPGEVITWILDVTGAPPFG